MTNNAVYNVDRSEWILALPRLAVLAVKLGFDRNVPWETKTALGGGLLYILSPIDGIPDFIPIIGQLEDILIAILLIDGMVNHIDRAIVMKHWTGRAETLDSIGRLTRKVTDMLPAFIRDRVMKKAFKKSWKPGQKSATGTTGRVIIDA